MQLPAVIVVAALVAAGCGGTDAPKRARTPACAPTVGEPGQVSAPSGTGKVARVRLGPGGDVERTPKTIAAGRGKPLLVTGTVRGSDCAPLAGASVNVWQTNGKGDYGPGQTCCYLQGTVRTDRDGHYTVETVVPGGYESRPPHIHFEVAHEAAEGVLTEVMVEGRPSRLRNDIVLRRR